MAILKVTEFRTGLEHDAELSGNRTYVRVFLVHTSGPDTDVSEVREANDGTTGIPLRGTGYPADPQSVVKRVNCQQYSSGRSIWLVTVSYGTSSHDVSLSYTDKPWNKPAKVGWATYRVTEAANEDVDGQSLTNTAGDLFDPPPPIEVRRPTLTIQRFERTYDQPKAEGFVNTVNSAQVILAGRITPAETALMDDIKATEVVQDGERCWNVTYTIMFRPDTWRLRVLSQGFYFLDPDNAFKSTRVKEEVPDENGEFKDRAEPILLAWDGDKLPAGSPPHFMNFRVRKRTDWTALGLP